MRSILAAILLIAAPLAVAQATDVGWPREVKGKDGSVITVYQPQLERWESNRLSGRAAVSVAKPGEKDPRFGVIELGANTDVDKSADMVMLSNVRIVKGSFPGTRQEQSDAYLATLRAALPAAGAVPDRAFLPDPRPMASRRYAKEYEPHGAKDGVTPQVVVATRPTELLDHCLNDGVRGKPIVELLRPDEEDYFVLKPKHSAFHSTSLDILLDHLGTKTLVLTGVQGDFCVMLTAHDACMQDFKLIVPADCVASDPKDDNRFALAHLAKVCKAEIAASAQVEFERR